MPQLADESEYVRECCALLLAEFGYTSGTPTLTASLSRFDSQFRHRAVLALTGLGDTSAGFMLFVSQELDAEIAGEVRDTLALVLGNDPSPEIRLHTELDGLVVDRSSILRGSVSKSGSAPAFDLRVTLSAFGRQIKIVEALSTPVLEPGQTEEWEIPFIPETAGIVPYAWTVEYRDLGGRSESVVKDNVHVGDRYGPGMNVIGDYVIGVKQGDEGIAVVRGASSTGEEPIEAGVVEQSSRFCHQCGQELSLSMAPRFWPFCGTAVTT